MKKNYLFLLFTLFTCSLFAQEGQFEARSLSYKHEALNNNFTDYEAIQLNSKEIYQYALNSKRNDGPFYLELQMPDGEFYRIYLQENNRLKMDKTRVITAEKGGKKESEFNDPILTLKGFIYGVEGSRVALTLADGIIYGYINNGVDLTFIEPASYLVKDGQKDLFIMYDSKAVKDQKVKCGYNAMEEKKEEQKSQLRADPCLVQYNVELAIAADFSMYNKYLNNGGVTAYLTGVMNNVQTNYDDEFDQAIIFIIVVYWISPCNTCDPWTTSTSSFTLVNDFADWGEAGGFGNVDYDIGGFWTDRDLDGGVVGRVVSIGGTCGPGGYHICQDFTTNAQQIRVLTAHEIGHNLGLTHVSDGCIMNPFVTTSNCWAPFNLTQMANSLPNFACLEEVFCELEDLPATPPSPINVLCGSGTRCATLDIECGEQLFYSESDQELEISSDGMTICLQSTDCEQRITPVDIFVQDPCGQFSPVATWNINIDPSPLCCFFSIPTPTRFYCVRERGGIRIYWTGVTGAAYYDWQLIGGSKCCRTAAPASYRGSVRGTSVFLPDSWLNRGCYTFSARTADGLGRFSAYASYCYTRCLSDIIPVEEREQTVEALNEKATYVEIAPNPNNGHFSMILDAEFPGERSLRVIDLKGQEIWTAKKNVQKGENIIDIDIPTILSGIYILSVNDGKEMKMKKFVVNSSLR